MNAAKVYDQMPDRDEVAAGAERINDRDVAYLLMDHGINPWNIPIRLAALTEAGYIHVTGEDAWDGMPAVERRPWPASMAAETVQRILDLSAGLVDPD